MAVDLMGMLKGAVSDQIMGKIGGTLGMEPKKTSSAFETISAAILGGMMKKASSPDGAKVVFEAASNQDVGILDKLGDLMGGGEQTDALQKGGGGLLETILGRGQSKLLGTLAKAIGIDEGLIGKLAAMAAPVLMAVVGRHLKAKALDAVGLGDLLGEQKQHLGKYMPASLTSSLGFDDILGNAGAAVSGAAGSVAGAGRSAAGSAGKAANEAASASGGLLKMLLPLIILLAIGWALWKFVVNKPAAPGNNPTATAGEVDFDLSKFDVSALGETGLTLKNGFSDIATGLTGLTAGDTDGANKLAEVVSGFTGKIGDMNLGSFDGAKKTMLTTLIDGFKGKIDELLANLPDALKNIIKPAIEGLMTKLKM